MITKKQLEELQVKCLNTVNNKKRELLNEENEFMKNLHRIGLLTDFNKAIKNVFNLAISISPDSAFLPYPKNKLKKLQTNSIINLKRIK